MHEELRRNASDRFAAVSKNFADVIGNQFGEDML
jgi:hypothetical protein